MDHPTRADDPRPLWVLIWGGIDDLAEALHDDLAIASKLRVYYIGGPSKKWAATAYDYIAREHPGLWIIENNSTYYGWFTGGDQSGYLDNTAFVQARIKDHGALGDYFAAITSNIEMGDTLSLDHLLGAHPEVPAEGSWGRRFVRAWNRSRYTFVQSPVTKDVVKTYAILDIHHRSSASVSSGGVLSASLVVDKQEFPSFLQPDGTWIFLFSPKEPKIWTYTVKSNHNGLDAQTGGFTSQNPDPIRAAHPSGHYSHWGPITPISDTPKAGIKGRKPLTLTAPPIYANSRPVRNAAGHGSPEMRSAAGII